MHFDFQTILDGCESLLELIEETEPIEGSSEPTKQRDINSESAALVVSVLDDLRLILNPLPGIESILTSARIRETMQIDAAGKQISQRLDTILSGLDDDEFVEISLRPNDVVVMVEKLFVQSNPLGVYMLIANADGGESPHGGFEFWERSNIVSDYTFDSPKVAHNLNLTAKQRLSFYMSRMIVDRFSSYAFSGEWNVNKRTNAECTSISEGNHPAVEQSDLEALRRTSPCREMCLRSYSAV